MSVGQDSHFWDCGKVMKKSEFDGIYPLMYLLHSDQICKGLDVNKDLKGNPAYYAIVLGVFLATIVPECSIAPWEEAHSEELSSCYWLALCESCWCGLCLLLLCLFPGSYPSLGSDSATKPRPSWLTSRIWGRWQEWLCSWPWVSRFGIKRHWDLGLNSDL